MDTLVALYQRLPLPARSAAATLRGLYLRYWREGGERARLEEEARNRDTWTTEQWRAWREERLAVLLHRAATRVPYYREQWAARRQRGDRSSWDRLEHWTVLEKDAVRATPRAFVADDCDIRRMYHERTSGTTGKPLETWRSLAMVRTLYAIVDARTRAWDGIPRGARFARLGGQLVVPPKQPSPPFWVWNAAMRQLYMSVYHLSPALIPHYLDALAEYRIEYLAGYTSSLHALALEALRLGHRDLRMIAAFTNAEPLSPDQRATISAAFHCPVRDSYGMAEAVAMGSECAHGRLHLWPEMGLVEVHGADGPVAPGTLGELVCTGLLNVDMPLIRYRVGDRGRLAPEDSACPCGRTLPQLSEVAGRTSDVLVTRDGRQVFWLNPVFYGLPVREAQIVQETLDRVRVLVAPAPRFTAHDARRIVERLRDRMGPVTVTLEYVEAVPRTAGGKVRAVVCALNGGERAAALHRAPQATA
ncbi:MAG TPA: hypothetical protein VF970_01205 [Gemmatimonadales bacterium]